MLPSWKDRLTNFSFVLPALIIFSLFWIYPFFYTIVLSLQDNDLISPPRFVGLDNFKIVWSKQWWSAMYNAGFITLWALTFQNILAFMLALSVDRIIRLRKFYRVVFFLLPVLSEVIIGLLMKQLLAPDPPGRDVFNHILDFLGLNAFQQNWLGRERVRLVTALVHSWKGFGWAFILLLAGLQSIPEQLYEAARIDGANAWQCFYRITVPLLMPVITMVVILTILGTMQTFAMILALTGGAAGLTVVPVMQIYSHIKGNIVGQAAAEGLFLGVILVAFSFSMLVISRKIRERYGILPD